MLKIGIITACLLGGNAVHSQGFLSTAAIKKMLNSSSLFVFPHTNLSPKNNRFIPMFGLPNERALCVYHYGLKFLKSDYSIPTEIDQIRAIRSHHSYFGKLSKPLTQREAMIQLEKLSEDFLIFEVEAHEHPHFHLVHPQGVRHFVVKGFRTRSGEYPGKLCNGDQKQYTNIDCFVKSTFV